MGLCVHQLAFLLINVSHSSCHLPVPERPSTARPSDTAQGAELSKCHPFLAALLPGPAAARCGVCGGIEDISTPTDVCRAVPKDRPIPNEVFLLRHGCNRKDITKDDGSQKVLDGKSAGFVCVVEGQAAAA
jgi:hypothetical protein